MKHEILAILSGEPQLPPGDFALVRSCGFTAVLVPASSPWMIGKALRRHRLSTAARRQGRLETLMAFGTVLPFTPGCVIETEDAEAMISANADLLEILAERLAGCVQYQVSVSWAEDRVLERFRESSELAPLFGGGRVSGAEIAGAVARLTRRLSTEMTERLAALSREAVELPCGAGMIANCVLLLRGEDEPALDRALEEIDAIWPDGLKIRQIGPGPAASFASLRVQSHRAADVARARQVLGLPEEASAEAIESARRDLLRRPEADVAAIRAAARLVEAARRAGRSPRPLHLLDLWSEGRTSAPGLDQVA